MKGKMAMWCCACITNTYISVLIYSLYSQGYALKLRQMLYPEICTLHLKFHIPSLFLSNCAVFTNNIFRFCSTLFTNIQVHYPFSQMAIFTYIFKIYSLYYITPSPSFFLLRSCTHPPLPWPRCIRFYLSSSLCGTRLYTQLLPAIQTSYT